MERVIDGFIAGTAAGSFLEDDVVLVDDRDFLRRGNKAKDVSDEESTTFQMEEYARKSILALTHASRSSASGIDAPASLDLLAAFRSLGATGRPEVLRTAALQTVLVKLSRDMTDANGGNVFGKVTKDFSVGEDAAAAAIATAAKIATRLTGGDGIGYGVLTYRRFEDWLMPPRGLPDLRGVLVELVKEGSALGLSAADLFLQLSGGDSDSSEDGADSHEFREGLASLSIHLTKTEVETMMIGAGCIGGDKNDTRRLTLDMFLTLIKNRPGQQQRMSHAATVVPEDGGSDVTSAPTIAVDTRSPAAEQPGSILSQLQAHERWREDNSANLQDECVTPDSLAPPVRSPRMSLSELTGLGEGVAGGGSTTSNAVAAHMEALERATFDGQAVLTTAGSGVVGHCDGQDERGGSSSSSPTGKGIKPPAVKIGLLSRSATFTNLEAERTGLMSVPAQTPARLTASDFSPVPRTRAITPPLGPARSPPKRLHPTRESRERLKAALETLDLKERLKPTVGAADRHARAAGPRRNSHSAGGRLPTNAVGGRFGFSKDGATTLSGPGPAPATISRRAGVSGPRRPKEGTSSRSTAVPSRRGPADRGDTIAGTRVTARTAVVGGGSNRSRDGLPVAYRFGRSGAGGNTDIHGGGFEPEEGYIGEAVDGAGGGNEDAVYGGKPRDVLEVIGRLRMRVAELELTEKLLRCELDGARADLVAKGRQAKKESREKAERAKEREQALQTRMGARIRAAEAEAAATENRLADFMRSSQAESAAREKSSAEYLRRRIKKAEAALETKSARLSAKRHQTHSPSPSRRVLGGRRRQGWGEDDVEANCANNTSGGAGGGSFKECAVLSGGGTRQARRTRFGSVLESAGGVNANDGAGSGLAAARLRKELDSCRKKMGLLTAETSRLRKEAEFLRSGGGRDKKDEGRGRVGRLRKRMGKATMMTTDKACSACGQTSRSCRKHSVFLGSSIERQRERERRLESRLAASEDARIKIEAEAERLQAFLDEMRGRLGVPFAQVWHGERGAAE